VLLRRLASSAVILSIVGLICWLDLMYSFGLPGIWLMPICLFLSLSAVSELLDMMRSQGLRPAVKVTYTAATLVVLGAYTPVFLEWATQCKSPLSSAEGVWIAITLGMMLAFVCEVMAYQKPNGVVVRVALSVLTTTYIGLLMTFVVALRVFRDNETGMIALLSMVIIVKSADTGAYIAGKLFGWHKMAPRLSPKKTFEGIVGGVILACVASWITFEYVVPAITGGNSIGDPSSCYIGQGSLVSPLWCLSYAIALTIAGIVGDLVESLLKRDMEQKDSSSWLPGLGGMLDLLDSMLFAAPVAYLWWTFTPIACS